jgi:Domain of unknown function (DUF4845)
MIKQQGLTMSGFLTWAVIFAIGALLAFKLGPAYTEDLTIQKHFKVIANDSSNASGVRSQIENAYSKRAEIDRITVLSPKDIVISKEGGGLSLSASYTVRIPLVHNISACMDFNPSSH